MGHRSAAITARQRDFQRQKERKGRRSLKAADPKRQSAAGRVDTKLTTVFAKSGGGKAAPPTPEQVSLIKSQLFQAARVYGASRDLCRMISEGDAKTVREISAEIFPHAEALATDPLGSEVITALLNALPEAECQRYVDALVGCTAQMCVSSVSRGIVWALIEKASEDTRQTILSQVVHDALSMTKHRHGSITLLKLFEHHSKPARRAVLKEVIDELPELATHSVAATVIQGLVTPKLSKTILESVQPHLAELIASRRGNKLLLKLVENGDAEVLRTIYDAISPEIVSLCQNVSANFFVQELLVNAGEDTQLEFVKTVRPELITLCKHNISTHVIIKLVESGAERTRAKLMACVSGDLQDMSCHQFGSLVVRRLLEHSGSHAQLFESIRPNLPTLATHKVGNLVVQSYLKHCSKEDLAKALKWIKPNIVSWCQDPCAAHVVCGAIDRMDATQHHEVFAVLRPHILQLAQHVNGRFIVVKFLSYKEGKNEVIRAVPQIALCRGGHFIVEKLMEACNAEEQKAVVTTICRDIVTMCKDQNGTLVVQKLVTSAPQWVADVRGAIGHHANALLQDRFGRFVVRALQNLQQQ